MNIFRQLTEKPWLAGRDTVVDIRGGAFYMPTASLGLRVFLAVIAVLFSILIVAYAERMSLGDWRSLPDPWLLWPNTFMLILSSIALQSACVGAREGQVDRVKTGLTAGGVFAFAFLLGQLLVWRDLIGSGYFAASNPANAFFYLLTAIHGFHLMGGLVAWGRTSAKLWRGTDSELAKLRLSVELCAVYWHFLLLVWLIFFALLLIT